jgi:hypothetical protein
MLLPFTQLNPMRTTSKNHIVLSTTTASWIHKLSFSFLLAVVWASPSWAKIQSTEIVGNPSISNDRVTVRIKAKQVDGKPVMDLEEENFKLLVDGRPIAFKSKDWKSAKEATPPPVWIVFLLDYSGSMKGKDTKGTTKIAGAINAIYQFTQSAAKRGGSTNVSIVPFGESKDPKCNNPVTPVELDKFFSADDVKVRNQLESLLSGNPCASTNIYGPVAETVSFFTNSKDSRFQVNESDGIQPRLVVVILSDGYHNKENEAVDFERLIDFLRRKNDTVSIHTLGYGLTPEALGSKYKLGRSARRSDVGKNKKVPEEEFVDRAKLFQIADATGGIAEFSPDAKTVSEKLDLFLNAILGEYEITYNEPNPERGSKHNVQVTIKTATKEVSSSPKDYIVSVFGRPVPLQKRLLMLLGLSAFFGVSGILPFWLWGQELKKEAT